MSRLELLHQPPVRFAQYVIDTQRDMALVRNEFSSLPSLSMLVEAAAQSSAAVNADDEKSKMGYLTSLRNIKLLLEPSSLHCDIKVTLTSKIDDIGCFSFEAIENGKILANGSFVVVSKKESSM